MSTVVSVRLDDETLAAIDALGVDRAGFVREAAVARLSGGVPAGGIDLGDGDALEAGDLAMLDGVIRGRAKGREDRGLAPEVPPWTRARVVRKLLDDRISFSSAEAVAISKLKRQGSEPAA